MENRIKSLFAQGRPSLGCFSHLLSETAVQALGQTGLDYVILDMEHSPLGADRAAALVAAADGAGLCPLVRVDHFSRIPILKALDAGAAGVVVPQLDSLEQARELVRWAKFAPLGARGFCYTRDCGWGYAPDAARGPEAYMAAANAGTLLLPQCETAGCLAQIGDIVALEGVDGVFIGPFDLSIALGIPGRFDDPRHLEAVARVREACARAGKLCVMFAGDPAAATRYFAEGFPSVTLGMDLVFLIDAVRRARDAALGAG